MTVLTIEQSDQIRKAQQNNRGRQKDLGLAILQEISDKKVNPALHRYAFEGLISELNIEDTVRKVSLWYKDGKPCATMIGESDDLFDVSVVIQSGQYKRLNICKRKNQDSDLISALS